MTAKDNRLEFENKIRKILGEYSYVSCRSCAKDGSFIELQIQGKDLTFDNLCEISKLFKTKLIDIKPVHEGPGCDTCGHGEETYISMEIKNATL